MSAMLALLLAGSVACDVPAAERERQVALGYEAFDSAPGPHGWRSLNGAGCTDAAVALLEAYRAANASKLAVEQRLELPFHIGQAYAFASRDREAAPWFGLADAPDASDDWRAFVAAHIAFFRHDREALGLARARYAVKAGPNSMRLKVIDGFLACPDKSYMEAAHCAM